MQLGKKVKRKKVAGIKKDQAVIPTKKEIYVKKHRPLQITKTSKTLKNVHVTGLATAGKKKKLNRPLT
jgi:hypothetical protein